MSCCCSGSSSTVLRGRYSEEARMVRSTRSSPRLTRPCHAPSGKIVARGTHRTSSSDRRCLGCGRCDVPVPVSTACPTAPLFHPRPCGQEMPELPEVEALSRALDRDLRGRTVERVVLRSVAALKTYDPPVTALHGRRVTGCWRIGKFGDLQLDPLHLVVHLGRAGWLRIRAERGDAKPTLRGPLTARLLLAGGGALVVTEQGTEKRLAMYVVHDPDDVVGVARLGIDACDPALTRERLGELMSNVRGTVKSVLADQSVVAGIGNAYS